MAKRLKKYEYEDFKDEKKLNKLWTEIRNFISKRCKRDDVGDLPVQFLLRSRRLHYPFNDGFLIPTDEKQIDRAIDLQITNLSIAMNRLDTLNKLKRLYAEKK